jgi:hypothetical protein
VVLVAIVVFRTRPAQTDEDGDRSETSDDLTVPVG